MQGQYVPIVHARAASEQSLPAFHVSFVAHCFILFPPVLALTLEVMITAGRYTFPQYVLCTCVCPPCDQNFHHPTLRDHFASAAPGLLVARDRVPSTDLEDRLTFALFRLLDVPHQCKRRQR